MRIFILCPPGETRDAEMIRCFAAGASPEAEVLVIDTEGGGCQMAEQWEPACPHEFSAGVTARMQKWLRLFGVEDNPDRSYYFDINANGSMQLCDTTDGGAGIVFDLPDITYCPMCGARYRG